MWLGKLPCTVTMFTFISVTDLWKCFGGSYMRDANFSVTLIACTFISVTYYTENGFMFTYLAKLCFMPLGMPLTTINFTQSFQGCASDTKSCVKLECKLSTN